MDLNYTLNLIKLTDIYRAFHPRAAEYTFFSSTHGIFPRVYHMLGHETGLNKFVKIEIILSTSTNHNGMKLVINYKKKNWKIHKFVRIQQHVPDQ